MAAALLKMLAKAPADRFASARDFVARLREGRQGAKPASLYERLQAAVAGEHWAEVLNLGARIHALDAGYRDVEQLVAQARERLQRPQRKPLPTWTRWAAAGGAAAVLLVALAVTLGPSWFGASSAPTEAPAERPTGVSAAVPTQAPTAQPTEVPVATPEAPAEPPAETATEEAPEGPTLKPGVTRTRPADGMVMVYVPAGEFEMGSTEGDDDEQPVHTVALNGFWMDRTEVTNAQFAAFLNEQGNQEEGGVTWLDLGDEDCMIERVGGEFRPKNGYGGHPVVEVSWYGAAAYCTWVGVRLPTEAEWEYAARGQQGLVYPWGDEFDCSRGNFDDETQLDDYVVPGGEGCDGYARTAPVGSYPGGASWCDTLDMAGNVWEWVADWYGDYPSGRQVDPIGPSSGSARVVRGGSWLSFRGYARCASRDWNFPYDSFDVIGYRCVSPIS